MKILFITHKFFPDIGGIEVNSEIIARALHKEGFHIQLITWSKNMTSIDKEIFPFKIIRNPSLFQLFRLHSWADLVYENNPSIQLSWPNFIFNKPSVVALRTWLNQNDGSIGWKEKIKMFKLKKSSTVIAVSNSIRSKCWNEAIVIGNPYRQNIFKIMDHIIKDIHFVFLGRLVSDKGANFAILLLHRLLNANLIESKLNLPSLTIVGDGPEKENLKRLAIDLGIENFVTFAGTLQGNELVRCLNQHKFILVPSLWEEPFGNVALEGMACGCIPIVSDGGGLPEAIGNAGVVFKRGNMDDFFQTVEKLLNDQSLVEKLLKNIPDHLRYHHPTNISQQYINTIKTAFYKQN